MKRKCLIVFMLMILLMLVGCTSPEKKVTDNSKKEVVNITEKSEENTYSSLVQMISDVKESVVDIYSYASTFTSAGSGVIIGSSEEGYYVITNHHVIDGATTFQVVTYEADDSSTTYDASFVGGSPTSDIAVLKITTSDSLKTASFIQNSDTVKVGTEVVAIGNPLGILGGTVTKGIISATAREVSVGDVGYMKLFQTDAAINSGNSGGALFNMNGLLVGIVNSGYTDFEGLNFAIPANDAKKAMESIISTYHNNGTNYGYVEGESNLGITLDQTQVYSDANLNSATTILYIKELTKDGDGYKAGLKDYTSFYSGKASTFYAITKINGKVVSDATSATKLLQSFKASDTVEISYREINYKVGYGFMGSAYLYLDGAEKTVSITISQFIYSI